MLYKYKFISFYINSALVSLLFWANWQQTVTTTRNSNLLGKYMPGRFSAATIECGGALPAPCKWECGREGITPKGCGVHGSVCKCIPWSACIDHCQMGTTDTVLCKEWPEALPRTTWQATEHGHNWFQLQSRPWSIWHPGILHPKLRLPHISQHWIILVCPHQLLAWFLYEHTKHSEATLKQH